MEVEWVVDTIIKEGWVVCLEVAMVVVDVVATSPVEEVVDMVAGAAAMVEEEVMVSDISNSSDCFADILGGRGGGGYQSGGGGGYGEFSHYLGSVSFADISRWWISRWSRRRIPRRPRWLWR